MQRWFIAMIFIVSLGLTSGCSNPTPVSATETLAPEASMTRLVPTRLVSASPTIISTTDSPPRLSPTPGDTLRPATHTALPPPGSTGSTHPPKITATFTSQPSTSTPTFSPPTEPSPPTATFVLPPATPTKVIAPTAVATIPPTHTAMRPTEIPTENSTHTPLPPPATEVSTVEPTDTALPPPP